MMKMNKRRIDNLDLILTNRERSKWDKRSPRNMKTKTEDQGEECKDY
jgi:hypothetical protein